MGKLFLTLTLVALSSGVLCNVVPNQIDAVNWKILASAPNNSLENASVNSSSDVMELMSTSSRGHIADIVLLETGMLSGCMGTCRTPDQLPSGYVVTPGIGAHKLLKRQVKWNTARKFCMAEGGQLAILNSDVEAAVVMNWMKRENINRAWLGVHNYFEADEWVTVTGELMTGYATWSPNRNQPDNFLGDEHCVTIGHLTGMYDDKCTSLFPYICEINLC